MKVLPQFIDGLRKGLTTSRGVPAIGGPYAPREPKPYLRSWILLGSGLLAFALVLAVYAAYAGTALDPAAAALDLAPIEHPGAPEDALPPSPPTYALPKALAYDADVHPRAWTSVVVHHSASTRGGARAFDDYHRKVKGWQSLGYHFVVGNGTDTPEGAIEAGPRWRRQERGAHAHSDEYNAHGIGVCLVGNFEETRPGEQQFQATVSLVAELCKRFRIPPERIYGHRDVREGAATLCPGKNLPMDDLRAAVARELQR